MRTIFWAAFTWGFVNVLTTNAQTRGAEAVIESTHTTGNTYALVVGISDYQSSQIRDLAYAEADARAFIEYIRQISKRKGDTILSFFGPKATFGQVWTHGISYFFSKAPDMKTGDRVFLYFSGHGGSFSFRNRDNAYFFLYNAANETDGEMNLKIAQVKSLIQALVAQDAQVFFVFDACRSADVGLKGGLEQVTKAVESTVSGEVLLMATEGGDVAFESGKLKHGVFTYYLLRGLYGEADLNPTDGLLSGGELDTYLGQKVPSHVMGEFNGKTQYPFTRWGELRKSNLFSYDEKQMKTSLALLDVGSANNTVTVAQRGGGEKAVTKKWAMSAVQFEKALAAGRVVSPQGASASDYLKQLAAQGASEAEYNRYRRELLTALLETSVRNLQLELSFSSNPLQVFLGNEEVELDSSYYESSVKVLDTYAALCQPGEAHPGTAALRAYFLARHQTLSRTATVATRTQALQKLETEIKANADKSYLYLAKGLLLESMKRNSEARFAFQQAREWSPLWRQMSRMIERLDENEEH